MRMSERQKPKFELVKVENRTDIKRAMVNGWQIGWMKYKDSWGHALKPGLEVRAWFGEFSKRTGKKRKVFWIPGQWPAVRRLLQTDEDLINMIHRGLSAAKWQQKIKAMESATQ